MNAARSARASSPVAPISAAHAIIACTRDYCTALFGALLAAGIPAKHAGDCARNIAGPLAALDDVSVIEAVTDRLRRQREHFGLDVSDLQIERAVGACLCVPRFHEATAGLVYSPGAE